MPRITAELAALLNLVTMTGRGDAIRVYSRQGCHLCDELIEGLLPMVRGRIGVDVVDIDSKDEWRAAFTTRVPVVEYRGRTVCEFTLDRNAIKEILDHSVAS